MINVEDLEVQGRLILTLGDLIVRYFNDESGDATEGFQFNLGTSF